jgi:hypothetical protein
MNLHDIIDDIILEIRCFLDRPARLMLCLTCKRMNRFTDRTRFNAVELLADIIRTAEEEAEKLHDYLSVTCRWKSFSRRSTMKEAMLRSLEITTLNSRRHYNFGDGVELSWKMISIFVEWGEVLEALAQFGSRKAIQCCNDRIRNPWNDSIFVWRLFQYDRLDILREYWILGGVRPSSFFHGMSKHLSRVAQPTVIRYLTVDPVGRMTPLARWNAELGHVHLWACQETENLTIDVLDFFYTRYPERFGDAIVAILFYSDSPVVVAWVMKTFPEHHSVVLHDDINREKSSLRNM